MKLFHDLMANILIRWSNWHFVRGSFYQALARSIAVNQNRFQVSDLTYLSGDVFVAKKQNRKNIN